MEFNNIYLVCSRWMPGRGKREEMEEPVSKTRFSLSVEIDRGLTRDGTAEPVLSMARPHSQAQTRTGKYSADHEEQD